MYLCTHTQSATGSTTHRPAVGMLADMLAAGLNANLGGRDHMPIEVERQVTRWVRELFGFPDTATGLFVTGTSMANLIGLLVALLLPVSVLQILRWADRFCGLWGLFPSSLLPGAFSRSERHGSPVRKRRSW